MYETMMCTLRAFFGQGLLRILMTGALCLSVAALAAFTSRSFRAAAERARLNGGLTGLAAAIGTGVFKVGFIVVAARLLITWLALQSQQFGREHGRVTERNRSAVLMKWGYPHEQRELQIEHTRKRVWVTRQLQPDDEKKQIVSESYWKDEESPVQAIDGHMPAVIGIKEEVRDVPVPQKSLVAADIDIIVENNPRQLGNANYAGYEDTWRFKYVVANRSQWNTMARMSFPLPAKNGLFDNMYLKIDGKDRLDLAGSEDNDVCWALHMSPASETIVELGYKSRGLEHLRYIPKRMTRTGHYRVAMTIQGVPAEELDFPIGSMPAAERLSEIRLVPYTLTWKLDNALTSYDIGVRLPAPRQPDYYFADLLKEAPVGLVLLMFLLTVPRLILGYRIRLDLVAVLGVAYCMHYTFMGRLADGIPGFVAPFTISALILATAIVWFRLADAEPRILRVQESAFFAVSVTAYPLAVVDAAATPLWMQLFWLAALIYCCILMICRDTAAATTES